MRPLATLAGLLLASAMIAPAGAAGILRVAYAGSMGVVMDKALGPAFAKKTGDAYQGVGQGAYGLARLLAAKQTEADVFVSITPGPVRILQQAGMVAAGVPVASTAMVIVYNDKGPFAAQFEAAKAGKSPWWQVLESPGLKIARTDPATDPQGQNIIFTMLLAERYYGQPDLAAKILGANDNPAQIFAEPSAFSRLEAGQVDASSGYESAAISSHLPYIGMPDEVNLSNPAFAATWYDTVRFTLRDKAGKSQDVRPQPLVFYAAVLSNSRNPIEAKAFLDFLVGPEGQSLLWQNGYAPPKGGNI